MNEDLVVKLEPPRIENASAFLIAGLGERYTFETNQGIPQLWQRFAPYIGGIPGQIGSATYGACCNCDDAGNFDYIAGIEVSSLAGVPDDFSHIHIPAQKYIVFSHREHISGLRKTIYTIWNKWLPDSQHRQAETPDFERYDERFDPLTGKGVVEVWVPIK
jgi:AraC family transcriptional regulator